MYLITETVDNALRVLTESKDGNKILSIEGIFMQAEQKNKNGRMYPLGILVNEVTRYNNEYIKQNRALGELGHPEGPSVNLERVSHMLTSLKESGNDVIGKAKILGTPYGKIVENLIDSGVKLGVSSRGMGSLKEIDGINMVQEDFMLAAVDIVADPSAPNAFVNGIMEGKQWVWNNGVLKEQHVDYWKKKIQNTPSRKLEETYLKAFQSLLSNL
jgi:Prohead core protein serine protease